MHFMCGFVIFLNNTTVLEEWTKITTAKDVHIEVPHDSGGISFYRLS